MTVCLIKKDELKIIIQTSCPDIIAQFALTEINSKNKAR